MMRAKFGLWVAAVVIWAGVALTGAATAQERAWVQVEAQPSLAVAQERASTYAAAFPDVVGYRLGSRWYGIALGPYSPEEAAGKMVALKRDNLIPRDSFLTDGANFREPFWPDASVAPAPLVTPEAAAEAPTPEAALQAEPEAAPEATAAVEPAAPAEETPAEARRSEALLSREDRQDLQRALQWEGFYASAIDGAFGSGTRRSMADWQTALGLEPTGILTTRQRAMLVANWQADLADYGFATVAEAEAGIEITLPLGLVAFDHYEPPFVHFNGKAPDGMRVILISQPGDKAALYGLYDILQTLTIVPMDGERARGERSFEINAANGRMASYSYAETSQGLIKGYILVWPRAEAERAGRVLGEMKASFRAVGNRALDPGMVPMTASAKRGLLAGLELRRPRFSRSGFYVDAGGQVLTTAEAVAQCGRITLDGVTEATVTLSDAATGLAVLTPARALSPQAVAGLQLTPDRIGADVAVAGYSYEDTLPAPVMTYGTLEDVQGLNGEAGLKRLGIATLPGDAGGPVIDATGAVLGMLMPRGTDGARVLPEGVEFAAASAVIADVLTRGGVSITEAPPAGALAPQDLTQRAMDMTVLVGCWD